MLMSLFDALAPTGWPTFVLITSRVVGVMFIAPMWSMSTIPSRIRVALAITIALALAPNIAQVGAGESLIGLPLAIGFELLAGLTIGLTAALFLYAVTVAGEVVSVQMGLSIAAALAPNADIGSPGIGALKNLLALGTYFALGGHLVLLMGLADSFIVLPPGGALDLADGGLALVLTLETVFQTAVRVAAPLMAAMMLANVILAVLSKAVPQINTMMVAFPVTIGLGFIVFGASLPFIAVLVNDWVRNVGLDVQQTVEFLAPAPGQ